MKGKDRYINIVCKDELLSKKMQTLSVEDTHEVHRNHNKMKSIQGYNFLATEQNKILEMI